MCVICFLVLFFFFFFFQAEDGIRDADVTGVQTCALPIYARQFRMPNVGFDVQKATVDKGIAKQFPIILTSGRLVEYEGGGEETRSNKWLAELQQDMFIEINPSDAAERGIQDGSWVLVSGAAMASGQSGL